MCILYDKYKYILIHILKVSNGNNFYKIIDGIKIGENDFILENKKYIENIYKYEL